MHIQPVILHAQNTYNNGSFMMLINLIWYYVKHSSDQSRITFWIELDGEDNFQRLISSLPRELHSEGRVEIKQLPLKITSIDNSSSLLKAVRLFAKFYRHPRVFRKVGIDSIIILGGDDISEYYKKWMILSDLYRINRYSRKFPTVLAGQTIGPFKGLREKMASRYLSRTLIYTRDELTAVYLRDRLKLPEQHIRQSADLCFPELPGQETASTVLEDYGLTHEHYITLVPGGFYKLYTADREGYIKSWIQLTEKLLEEDIFRKKLIVLLPHVSRPEDDREMIRAIYQSFSSRGETVKRIRMIGEELMPHQLRQILGKGHFTISSRMHAALSTFQMKKPAIALGYSVKYEGVIGRSVQCPQLIVNCSAKLLGDPEEFSDKILYKTRYIEEHYQQLISHLEDRIPQLQVLAEDQIREICLTGEE